LHVVEITSFRFPMTAKTRKKNGANGSSRKSTKSRSGRASQRELAAMRAFIKATGPVPEAAVQAILDEWKAAAKATRA
jgi:hypothetical protein